MNLLAPGFLDRWLGFGVFGGKDWPMVRLPEPSAWYKVEFNERLFRQGKVGRFICNEYSAQLFPHPSILCHFSRPLGEGPTFSYQTHGMRPAVWRRDMRIPYCARCVVEDPYE